jgi:hypothetical protein
VQQRQFFDEIADLKLTTVIENGKNQRTTLFNIFEAYPEADPNRNRRENRRRSTKSKISGGSHHNLRIKDGLSETDS